MPIQMNVTGHSQSAVTPSNLIHEFMSQTFRDDHQTELFMSR